jgi:hypothetical protein
MAGFDPITAVANVVNTVLDRVLPDTGKNNEAKAALLQMQVKGELDLIIGQLEVNKVEAASSSLFVSGWRPFIGWICGSALGWHFIGAPVVAWVLAIYGKPVALPAFDMTQLITILIGMLGLGAYRTYEKKTGVHGSH